MWFLTDMALLLPALSFGLLIPLVARLRDAPPESSDGWESTLLIAACQWGGALVWITEGLGAFSAVRFGPLAAAWLGLAVGLGGVVLFQHRRRPFRLPGRPALRTGEWIVVAALASVVVGLLAVGWIAPSNNADSLLYHMARVVRWAQQGSLDHYATGYGHQLWNPPWAEMAILNLRVLFGSDRPANLVQGLAYPGVLVAVSGIARRLGLERGGRLLAVGFAASIPMAVLQATSTQNDLVTAFWLASAACLALSGRRGPLEVIAFGTALGLGLLTKGTFYVSGLVVAIWFALTSPWRHRPKPVLVGWLAIAGLILAFNAPHWSRNLATAGTPLGPAEWVAGHGTTSLEALKPKVALYPARLLRGLAPHLAGPWPAWNHALDAGVKSVYTALGVEVNAPIVQWNWNHEDFAGNPHSLVLIGLTGVGLVWRRRSLPRPVLELAGVALGAALLTALLVSPALTIVGVRLQLPLFVLWAPLVAAVASRWLGPAARWLAALLLVGMSLPWLLFNHSRPLIGLQPHPGPLDRPCSRLWGCTAVGSVLTASSRQLAFVAVPHLEDDFRHIADALQESTCRQVGLRIDSNDPEYLIWWLLQAPESGFRLATVYTTPELAPLLDASFEPCAVVCTICGGRERLHGLERYAESGPVKLFLGGTFSWDEDG